MRVWGYRASNPWLHRQLDGSWRGWLTRFGLGSLLVAVALAAFVGPRQTTIRLRYRIARVDDEIDRLAQQQRRLLLAREQLTSPQLLVQQLGDLDLEIPGPARTSFLTADGRLVRVTPPPAGAGSPRKDR